GEIAGVAGLDASAGVAQFGGDAVRGLGEGGELDAPVHGDAGGAQTVFEQALMCVLGIDQYVGVRADAGAHGTEGRVGDAAAGDPEIGGFDLAAGGDHGGGEVHLGVELEGAGLHAESAGVGGGGGQPVHDAHLDAEPVEPQRQHQAGGSGAGDENFARRFGERHRFFLIRVSAHPGAKDGGLFRGGVGGGGEGVLDLASGGERDRGGLFGRGSAAEAEGHGIAGLAQGQDAIEGDLGNG